MSKLKLQGFKMKRIGLKPTLRKPSIFFNGLIFKNEMRHLRVCSNIKYKLSTMLSGNREHPKLQDDNKKGDY